MTISRTGNRFPGRKKDQGFSFIETIVAVTILSVGLLFIFKAFFISLDYMGRIIEKAYVLSAVGNRTTMMQSQFERNKTFLAEPGDFNIRGKDITINYDVQSRKIENLEDLYEIDMTASWNNGHRESRLSRSFYVVNL